MPVPQNGETHSKKFVGKLSANCLSVFDHFVKLALEGLMCFSVAVVVTLVQLVVARIVLVSSVLLIYDN